MVVTEKRSEPKSGELEVLGSYHPKTKHTILKNERILYWIGKGAKSSATAHNLLVKKGVIRAKKINVAKKAASAAAAAKPTPAAQASPSDALEQMAAAETAAA